MAVGFHLGNGVFNNLAYSAVWFMSYRVFEAEKFIFDVSLKISLSSDLQSQYGWVVHLEYFIFNSLAFSALWLKICAEEVVSNAILIIRFSFDLQLENVRHLENICRSNLFHIIPGASLICDADFI